MENSTHPLERIAANVLLRRSNFKTNFVHALCRGYPLLFWRSPFHDYQTGRLFTPRRDNRPAYLLLEVTANGSTYLARRESELVMTFVLEPASFYLDINKYEPLLRLLL